MSALCSFIISYKQYIRIIHFFSFFLKMYKKKNTFKTKDIWHCTSFAKTFLFNINLELQKSDENWWRKNTLKSAHTVKKKKKTVRKTQMKWTNKRRAQLQIPASRLIEHCQATLEWTDFLWLNAFSSAQYYRGLFETKKKIDFYFYFSGTRSP